MPSAKYGPFSSGRIILTLLVIKPEYLREVS